MKERWMGYFNTLLTNTCFYRLYYVFYRSRVGDPVRLPRRSDDFYFDGYPRSGNTYVINLIRHVLQLDRASYTSHLHSIAGIKMALRMKLKPIVIIRHPKDSVASYYFTRSSPEAPLNMQLLHRLIQQYSAYYEFVYRKRKGVKIIRFEYVTKHEPAFIREIVAWLQTPEMDEPTIAERIGSYKALMKEKEGEKDIKISALPNQARSKHTATTKEELVKAPGFQRALDIYQRIEKEL